MDEEEMLKVKFDTWLKEKLGGETDVSDFTGFIIAGLSEEDAEEEETIESITPIIQELNQEGVCDEDELVKEVIVHWKKIKSEVTTAVSESLEKEKKNEDLSDSLSTISSMINKHKSQTVEVKPERNPDKAEFRREYEFEDSDDDYDYDKPKKSGGGGGVGGKKKGGDNDLLANTNMADSQAREKEQRDKMAITHSKQKDQTKKALIEQREKEAERKKKAQAKTAKVERKR